jgi:hypothetical protein
MNCVALSWQIRELFDEEEAAADQTGHDLPPAAQVS